MPDVKNLLLRHSEGTIPKNRIWKEPFRTGGSRFAAPGQEGLSDQM